MDTENPTTRERLTAVEVELKYVKQGIHDLKNDFIKGSERTDKRMGSYNKGLASLTHVVETKLRGSLSGREKASIVVALITSIGAIIISLLP